MCFIFIVSIKMKLISFDIGIKNMAYCVFSISGEHLIHTDSSNNDIICNYSILDWNVLNLMDIIDTPIHKCTEHTISSSKKNTLHKKCDKNAKYMKNDKYYCDKHAKQCSQFMIPKREYSNVNLKKMKIDKLFDIAKSFFLIQPQFAEKQLKKDLLKLLTDFFENKCLEPIITPKKKNAGDTDLINIGRNMNKQLNELSVIGDITHVIIENQISPIATRMKTIQGMLTQYFIIKNDNIHIEYVSSSNKLKAFVKNVKDIIEPPLENILIKNDDNREQKQNIKMDKKVYKTHKNDAIFFCSQIIEKNPHLHSWKPSFETKKKDDLADCFLQGVWYLDQRKFISTPAI